MDEIEHHGTVAMSASTAPKNTQEEFFRRLAGHYMDALTQIIVTDDLSECHRLAGIFLGSNPPPADRLRGHDEFLDAFEDFRAENKRREAEPGRAELEDLLAQFDRLGIKNKAAYERALQEFRAALSAPATEVER